MNSLSDFLKALRNNKSLMMAYASKKCKDCLGRGYVEVKFPEDYSAIEYMCSCVVKKAKQEF